MNFFFLSLTYWHWIGLAAILFIIEILTGTGFLLWIGIASAAVGLLAFLVPAIALSVQFIIFALISILTVVFWRIYLHYNPPKTDKPLLNKRTSQYIGREFTLQTPIVNGMGTVHIDDSMWRLRCNEDLAQGSQIRIIGADGVLLIAERSRLK